MFGVDVATHMPGHDSDDANGTASPLIKCFWRLPWGQPLPHPTLTPLTLTSLRRHLMSPAYQ